MVHQSILPRHTRQTTDPSRLEHNLERNREQIDMPATLESRRCTLSRSKFADQPRTGFTQSQNTRSTARVRSITSPRWYAGRFSDDSQSVRPVARNRSRRAPVNLHQYRRGHTCVQSNTTVLFPYASTRSSKCSRTARANTTFSRSRPLRTRSSIESRWEQRTTSCSMIGPSSSTALA